MATAACATKLSRRACSSGVRAKGCVPRSPSTARSVSSQRIGSPRKLVRPRACHQSPARQRASTRVSGICKTQRWAATQPVPPSPKRSCCTGKSGAPSPVAWVNVCVVVSARWKRTTGAPVSVAAAWAISWSTASMSSEEEMSRCRRGGGRRRATPAGGLPALAVVDEGHGGPQGTQCQGPIGEIHPHGGPGGRADKIQEGEPGTAQGEAGDRAPPEGAGGEADDHHIGDAAADPQRQREIGEKHAEG